MAEENTNVLENQGTENNGGTENTPPATEPEKKYTDDDVNNISKKNSEKAVSKLLKELGITDKEEAKRILAEAAAAKGKTEPPAAQDDTRVAELTASLESSMLENIMLSQNAKAEKISKAVKLIDRADCLDDEGKFSRDKATEAVKKLFEEWPELANKADEKHYGFSIGGDGQQSTAPAGATKPVKQKSWNRFN